MGVQRPRRARANSAIAAPGLSEIVRDFLLFRFDEAVFWDGIAFFLVAITVRRRRS